MGIYRKKIIVLTAILLFTGAVQLASRHAAFVHAYDRFLYYPWQSARGVFFTFLPFSIGDLLYFGAGCWLAITVYRWLGWLVHFKTDGHKLAPSLLKSATLWAGGYLLFLLGWGINYEKDSLAASWRLLPQTQPAVDTGREAMRKKSLERLVAFSGFLAQRLNDYAPGYQTLTPETINSRTRDLYIDFTHIALYAGALGVKPSFYTWFLDRLGVEGYYNPFTGEGQRSSTLPAFSLPFLVGHEMAHQAGIGSEEDANLLSYALCTASPDSTFRYSAYLEIWQYAYYRLFRRDSVTALALARTLNPRTRSDIDSLAALSKRYQNSYADYSTQLYDGYLKMHDQKDGIRSYAHVLTGAYLLEEKRKKEGVSLALP